jgi:hypothetical protein
VVEEVNDRDLVGAAEMEGEKDGEGTGKQQREEGLVMGILLEIYKGRRAMVLAILTREELEISIRVELTGETAIMVLIMAGEIEETMGIAMALEEDILEWAEGGKNNQILEEISA